MLTEPLARPFSFVSKTSCIVKSREFFVLFNDVATGAELQFTQTDRAEMHWPAVAFLETV